VGVLGARGKVGIEVCRAVDSAADLELVSAVDADDPIEHLLETDVQAVVDFTHPDVVMANLEFCIAHRIHAVVGTTGFDEARLDQLRTWLADTPATGVLIAPNFSIGAIMMMRFAAEAAPFFESVEVV
jgi:4-hydroxy-tetrahydrodipicolinate reductase